MNKQETAHSIVQATGGTSLVALKKLGQDLGLQILVKLESGNPLGSVKDRVAVAMIEAAEREGILRPGMEVIEPTSGNTGIGLAFACASKDYHLTLTMPESMSIERRKLLLHLGAELVLTPAAEGMRGAINKAEALLKERHNSWMPNQFANPANPAMHKKRTGPEIWQQCAGKLHTFVAGVGTGGTISGAGAYLKEQNSVIKTVAVEPAASPVLSGGKPGPHKIQGIGAGFVPAIYDRSVVDEIVQITDEEALETARLLAKNEGILSGISGGAALAAALKLGTPNAGEKEKQIVVVILPDSGERYLSTALFAAD